MLAWICYGPVSVSAHGSADSKFKQRRPPLLVADVDLVAVVIVIHAISTTHSTVVVSDQCRMRNGDSLLQ